MNSESFHMQSAYTTPVVEIIDMSTEHILATSLENPLLGDEMDW